MRHTLMPAAVLVALGLAGFAAPAAAQQSWMVDSLMAGAKSEGEITIYGSMNEEEALPYWHLFQDASGVKANYVRSSDAAILARIAIETRARQRTWDLVATTPVYRLPDEVLLKFEPPEAKNLIPQARGPNGRWYGVYGNYGAPPTTPNSSRKRRCPSPTRSSSATRNGPDGSPSTRPIPSG
jgi:hypothetical protein